MSTEPDPKIDGEELANRIEGELLGPGWDWEDDRMPGLLAKQAVSVIRPHLARLTDQAQKARAALVEAQDERDGEVRAVKALLEAVMWLSEDPKLINSSMVQVVRERFADRIAALDARDAKEV